MRQTLLAPRRGGAKPRRTGRRCWSNLPLLEQFGFALRGLRRRRAAGAGGPGGHRRRRHECPCWRSWPSSLRDRQRTPDERPGTALLHTMACKAAIKGGWVSDPAELRVLVDRVAERRGQILPPRPPGGGEADASTSWRSMFKRA